MDLERQQVLNRRLPDALLQRLDHDIDGPGGERVTRVRNHQVDDAVHQRTAGLLGQLVADGDESGTLQTEEVCRLLDGKGRIVVMVGTLGDNAATQRTADIHRVLETPECNGIEKYAKRN